MLLFVIDNLDNDSDKAFMEKLYIEYMPLLRSRVYKHIQDINICNDISHDCMISIIKHIDKIKDLPENKIRAYITVCIDNQIKNYLKRSSKQVTNKMGDISGNYSLADDVNIEDEVEKKYDYQSMKSAFDKLHERDKSIIIMKYDLELNDSQIADVLEIKPDSVRMTVLRSIKKLKKQIKKQEELS